MTEVRAAVPSDAPRLFAILQAAYAPFVDILGPDAPPLQQDIKSDIAEGDCLVAGTPALGFAVSRLSPDKIHLENLAVDPSHQRAGAGRLLVAAVEARGRNAGCSWIRLATSPGLKDTRAFYNRMEYSECGGDARRIFLEKLL